MTIDVQRALQQETQQFQRQPAHRIRTDAEALEIAHRVAAELAREASQRDLERRLPVHEIDLFSQSGLWGITVPKAYGGAGVSNTTLAEVIKTISIADPSLGQIPQNHLYIVEALRINGTEFQKQFFFDLVLQGFRFGNAFSEIGTKHVNDIQTRLTPTAGGYRIHGRKFYSSGALFADWIPTVTKNPQDQTTVAFVKKGSPGLQVIDDWSGFGQRTTASGTTLLDGVFVPPEFVLDHYLAFEHPSTIGPVAQIIQAAVDAGIAHAALNDTLSFVRQQTRPWIDAQVEHGYEDPLTLRELGALVVQVHAADALLEKAGQAIDRAQTDPTETLVAQASIAVAEAKILTTEIAVQAGSKLFELAGSRATLREFNLDRHWRNARTHTLHDPVRWKYHAVGNYALNHINPPRHPWF